MYRLGELTDRRRKAIGSGLLLLGVLGLVVGVVWIHWSSLPETELIDGVDVVVTVDYLNWFPRGTVWLGVGYLIYEITNDINRETMACFVTTFDYVVT